MADRYLIAGGNGQWNSTSNWSATSGGAAGASFPTAADNVIFNAASANANITVDVASACNNITTSSYTGTLTVNSTLSCSAGFSFAANTGYAGLGTLSVGTTASVTSNGVYITGTFLIPGAAVCTLADTLNVNVANFNATTNTCTINSAAGIQLKAQSLISPITSGSIVGTTKIVLTGTGTVSFPSIASGFISNNIDINSTSTTFTGNFRYQTGTITHIAGTVTTTGSTLFILASCGLNTAGMSWDSISLNAANGSLTVTLGSNLNLTGTISFLGNPSSFPYIFTGGSFTVNAGTLSTGTTTTQAGLVLNGATINTNSFIAPSVTSCTISGTSKIVLTGTGTVNIATSHTGAILNNIDINSTSTTFIGNFRYRVGTLTRIAGTVTTTGSTLFIPASCGLNTAGMNWDNISLDSSSGNLTVTLGSNLNLTGTISFLGSASSFFYAFTGGSFTVNAGTLSTGTTTSQAGLVLNGATINTNSFIAPSITGCNISGTSKIVLTGTGTVNIADTHTAFINNSIDINSTSTTFIGNFRYRAGTVRHIAGTVTTTNSTLRIFGTCGLNTVGMNWNNISLDSGSGSLTVTLGSNLNLTGTISFLGSSSSFPYIFTGSSFTVNAGTLSTGITTSQAGIVLNGATINTNSFIAPSVTSCNISGTSKIVLTGTGTVNIAATHTAFISNSIDINSTSTTFVGNFRYQTGTLRYIAGTVDTSASTLVLTAASTLNTAGLEWNNITIGAALTLTLTSAFTCSGTFTIVAALTVVGTGFWTRVGNLTITGSNLTLTLLNNLTVTGTFRNSSTFTINGNSLFVSSLKAGGYVFGTTTIVFNSTGTWSGAWDVANNVTINTAGTLTIGIGSSETVVPSTSEVNYAAYKTGTLTYTAGTVTLGNPSTGYLFITGSCTLNTSGMTWGSLYISTATTTLSSNLNVTNIRFSGTNSFVGANRFTQASTLTLTGTTTLTLLNNVTVLNNFICNNSGGVQTINGFQLICNGGITTTGTGNTAGTTTILLNGTGTWSAPLITDTNAIRNNTVINTAGTITFSGYPQFNTGTLTYTAGTVVTTGAQLSCWANTTLNTAGISWDIVSFVGTITLASNLTVTGRAKIGGTTTFVNTNRFTQVPILEIVNSATLTLINNLTVTNTFISSNNGSAQAMNGFQVICNGGITTTGTGYIAGTTSILLNGTGTWTSDSSNIFVTSNAIRNNTTINTAGTITFVDKVSFNTGTLTYVAGTLVTAGGVLACNTSTTLNTPGVNWHTVLFGGTITLSSVINVTDTAILSGTVTFIGANRFTQTGNLKLINSVVLTMINNITVLEDIVIPAGESTDHDLGTSSAFQIYTGGFDVQGGNTSGSYQTLYFNTIVVNGTSTWQGSVYLQGNLIINTAGTLTVTGLVYAKQGSITYQAGTVVTTDSTLNCDGGIVLNTSGLLWDNVKFGGRSYNSTYTLNSTLNVTGTLYLNNAYTGANSYLGLNGTAGFIASGLIVEQKQSLPPFFEYPDTYSLILQSGVTYEVLNTFTATNNAERLRLVIKSSTPEQKTYLKLAPSAIQRLAYVSATDIDSSAGQKIWSYDTILTRTENWQDLSLIVQDLNVGSTSVENAYTWLA